MIALSTALNQRELADAAENAVCAAFPTESFASNTLRVFT